MPTSIHLPRELLDAVDRRARALRMSRSKLIARALERELNDGGRWSPGFFDRLAAVDDETRRAVEDLAASIRAARRSKGPPSL